MTLFVVLDVLGLQWYLQQVHRPSVQQEDLLRSAEISRPVRPISLPVLLRDDEWCVGGFIVRQTTSDGILTLDQQAGRCTGRYRF